MSFFRSRWVEKPEHVTELEPDALPKCFCSGGAAAGIKPKGLDVGVLASFDETTSAARFTTNARVGAPVIASKEARLGGLRAIVANSGCSNVGDGDRGLETARAMQQAVADELELEPDQVGVASTGVIGLELPRDKAVSGTRAACGALSKDARDFSEAILTGPSGRAWKWPSRPASLCGSPRRRRAPG
jgi:glutamate N-acetyltransferase / amino-acid N-acetyltransferase